MEDNKIINTNGVYAYLRVDKEGLVILSETDVQRIADAVIAKVQMGPTRGHTK